MKTTMRLLLCLVVFHLGRHAVGIKVTRKQTANGRSVTDFLSGGVIHGDIVDENKGLESGEQGDTEDEEDEEDDPGPEPRRSVIRRGRKRYGYHPDPDFPSPSPSDEKRLTKKLLENYKRIGDAGRPIVNSSLPVTVYFGLAMIQMGLDERVNTLSISVWCRYRWVDEYLTWNPDDFGGVRSVRLSSKKVWIPDIMLYNTADTHKMEREVLVVVSYNGSILWIPHRIYRSSCSVDVTNFPFDNQTCHMTFGSWAYHGNDIDLRFFEDLDHMDVTDLEKENTEWEIIAKRERREIQFYDCCTEPYVTLIFTLELKRKLVFSSVILTLPCIFLAFMTLVVFWLPPERPDRTSLAMNLFASFLLLLLILVEAAAPTASSVPKLGIYYCFNMVLIMLSIFLSSVIINVSRRGETRRPVPNWLRVIALDGLAKVCCTRYSIRTNRTPPRKTPKDESGRPRSALFVNQDAIGEGVGEVTNGVMVTEPYVTASLRHSIGGAGCNGSSDSFNVKVVHSHFVVLEKQLRSIESLLVDMGRSLHDRDTTREMRVLRMEWQLVAIVTDKCFFYIFCLAIVLSLFYLFPNPFIYM